MKRLLESACRCPRPRKVVAREAVWDVVRGKRLVLRNRGIGGAVEEEEKRRREVRMRMKKKERLSNSFCM